MSELEKATYITKFFDRLEKESNGQIFATFTFPVKKFNVQMWEHSYEWTIDQAQSFVQGWNVRGTYECLKKTKQKLPGNLDSDIED